MNLNTTVKMRLVLILLCSGVFHFISALNRLRLFNIITEELYLDKVRNPCNQTNGSLVTLYDEEDANFTVKFSGHHNHKKMWLGLHLKENQITKSAELATNESRAAVAAGQQLCEAIDKGELRYYNCSERKPFMCYKDGNCTLVENEKDWCQALHHCRTLYSGLASKSNISQTNIVNETGKNTSFWIGVLHDDWEWQDKSCSTFRKWTDSDRYEGTCAVYDPSDQFSENQVQLSLYPHACEGGAHPFCSKGTVRIKVIEERLPWEQAYDYCKANHTGLLWIEDSDDQEAVQQWLNFTHVDGPFWIGLRQSRVFGTWIWAKDVMVTYSNWRSGRQPELPLSNHCGVIHKEDKKWSDENCWIPQSFLCEEEIEYL